MSLRTKRRGTGFRFSSKNRKSTKRKDATCRQSVPNKLRGVGYSPNSSAKKSSSPDDRQKSCRYSPSNEKQKMKRPAPSRKTGTRGIINSGQSIGKTFLSDPRRIRQNCGDYLPPTEGLHIQGIQETRGKPVYNPLSSSANTSRRHLGPEGKHAR